MTSIRYQDSDNNTPLNISFLDIFDLDQIQIMQDQFADATGVASIITYPDGTPISKPSNFCRLCSQLIRVSEKGLANCYKSDAKIGKLCVSGPTVQQCMSGGLWDAGAGISVGGVHIANWLIGQVRDATQTAQMIRNYAREIEIDEDEAAAAFEEVTSMSYEQFQKISSALFTLANHLSNAAYQNLQLKISIEERKKTEEELRRNEEQFRNVFNATHNALFIHSIDGNIIDVNDTMLKMYGLTKEEALESVISRDLSSGENNLDVLSPYWKRVIDGEKIEFEWIARRPGDASEFPVLVNLQRVYMDNKPQVLAVVMDVSERKKAEKKRAELEAQLFHSQKMEGIGKLAGGVAHDFNNMLGGILGSADILANYITDSEEAQKYLNMIIESASRAADLTQNLLTFSRQDIQPPSQEKVHDIIQGAIAILEYTIDKRIQIKIDFSAANDHIKAVVSQLQSAFINLGINAVQAMPSGGKILICTKTRVMDHDSCDSSPFDIIPGEYIEIEFTDTGCGIPEKNLSHIFEPFFTTKPVGEGTGLGLAAVYGTIIQHRGALTVESTPGKGTTFRILLPLIQATEKTAVSELHNISGKGHVLIVDDEEVIRETSAAMLSELGYQVTMAEDAHDALAILNKSGTHFDLVILDMIMPKMSGLDCFREIKKYHPAMKVILSSGFSRDDDLQNMLQEGLAGFIQKPFRIAKLSEVVAAAIS